MKAIFIMQKCIFIKASACSEGFYFIIQLVGTQVYYNSLKWQTNTPIIITIQVLTIRLWYLLVNENQYLICSKTNWCLLWKFTNISCTICRSGFPIITRLVC